MFTVIFVLFIVYLLLKAGFLIYLLSYTGNTGIESTSESFKELESCVRNNLALHGITERALPRLRLVYWAVRGLGLLFTLLFVVLVSYAVYIAIT